MRFKNLFISFFSSLTIISFHTYTQADEIYNCDASVLKLYLKEFKCDNTNNYFLNNFYSDHLDRLKMEENEKNGFSFVKSSSINPLIEWLGLYTKEVSGKDYLVFGFPDQRMKRDSNSLWKAFNYEFNKIVEEPKVTTDLNNGYNSSIFSESF